MRSRPFHSPLITHWHTWSWVASTFGQTVLPKGLLNRASVSAQPQFGRCSWLYRYGQIFYGSGRRDGRSYTRGFASLPSRYRCLRVDALCRCGQDAAWCGCEAVGWLRRSIEANRNFPLAHFWLASALGLLGVLDEARTAAKAGLALDPDFTIRRLRSTRRSDNLIFLCWARPAV